MAKKVKALPFSEDDFQEFMAHLRGHSDDWYRGFFFGLDTGESGIRIMVKQIINSLNTLLHMPNRLGSFKEFLIDRLIALEEENSEMKSLSLQEKKSKLLTFLENSYRQKKDQAVDELITSTVDDKYKM